MQAKRDTPRRGQENVPIQANAVIASNTAPAIANPLRHPLHFACGTALRAAGGLYGMRAPASPASQAARALSISAPEALAGKPHDAQEAADASFGFSQAKQRQR